MVAEEPYDTVNVLDLPRIEVPSYEVAPLPVDLMVNVYGIASNSTSIDVSPLTLLMVY